VKVRLLIDETIKHPLLKPKLKIETFSDSIEISQPASILINKHMSLFEKHPAWRVLPNVKHWQNFIFYILIVKHISTGCQGKKNEKK